MAFSGFKDSDFDAYLSNKWSSNVFNLERLKVKQRLDNISQTIAPSMVDGDNLPLSIELSEEYPAIWNHHSVPNQQVFFARTPAARREVDSLRSQGRSIASLIEDPSPLHRHIFISLSVDQNGIEIALKLHGSARLDRDNAFKKFADFLQRERLLYQINILPADYALVVDGQTRWPCGGLSDSTLHQIVRDLPGLEAWIEISRLIPKSHVISAGEKFTEEAGNEVYRLLPLLHLIAWRRTNDYLGLHKKLLEQEKKTRSQGIERNDRVRIISGLLEGKIAVVNSIGGKGEVEVRLGTMVLKVDGQAITKV